MNSLVLDHVRVHAETATGPIEILAETTLELTERTIALVGPNGSGKSTLARLFNGLVSPSSGRVSVNGIDVATEGRAARRAVGFVFTDPSAQLVMPTVLEDVMLSLRRTHPDRKRRRDAALELLAVHGLSELADRSVHALSGGQRQRVALVGVLACEPEVIVADEPTTLLDLAHSRTVGNLLLNLEQQLVLCTHDLALASRCERALWVQDARVYADGPAAEVVDAYRRSVEEA